MAAIIACASACRRIASEITVVIAAPPLANAAAVSRPAATFSSDHTAEFGIVAGSRINRVSQQQWNAMRERYGSGRRHFRQHPRGS